MLRLSEPLISVQDLPAAIKLRSRFSSSGVQRIQEFAPVISSPLARPANVAGPRLAVTGAFNVESQPLAFPDVVRIDARRLQRSDVEKNIRTAGVVYDETIATLGIPHFQGPCSHCAYVPFAFRAARACASLFSNSARLSSSGRSKKLSLTYNPRSSSCSNLSILQSLNTQPVNANCSVPWSISSVHFTNSQSSKRVKMLLPRKSKCWA